MKKRIIIAEVQNIKIGNKMVGEGYPVFVIAEAGVNHNGDITIAKKLVDIAKKAGCDAVKFQTFKTENIITKTAPKAKYHLETTDPKDSWYNLLKSQELDKNAHYELSEYCKNSKIIFLSTPYDEESADLLEKLDVPAFKVASTDANNIPFLKYLAGKKRPIILSTGMCTLKEVAESVKAIRDAGCDNLALLHCTANYPAKLEDTNLRAMLTMKDKFKVLVGYSDHTLSGINSIAAISLGAVIFEKHITLDKTLPGPDHRSSLNPQELKKLVNNIRDTQKALGTMHKKPTASERDNRRKLRKSILARVDIPRGEVVTHEMLSIKRPGTGIPPGEIHKVLGKKAKISIKKDTVIKMEYIK